MDRELQGLTSHLRHTRGVRLVLTFSAQGFPLPQVGDFTGVTILVVVLLAVATAISRVHQRKLGNPRREGVVSSGDLSPVKNRSREQECGDLVEGLIGTYDLSDSEVVRAHVQKSLRGVGITAIRPRPGDSFNPREHNGIAAVPAPAPAMAFRIVRVLRPGWKSMKGTVRPADVEVYKEG